MGRALHKGSVIQLIKFNNKFNYTNMKNISINSITNSILNSVATVAMTGGAAAILFSLAFYADLLMGFGLFDALHAMALDIV